MDGGVRARGDEGSDGVETPSNEDGRAQGWARGGAQGGARMAGAGMGARRARGRRGYDAKVLIIRGMEM